MSRSENFPNGFSLSVLHQFNRVAQSLHEPRNYTEAGNYYSQYVPISKVMLKSIILGSSIAALSTLFLPALATDWRTTGVSTRTRETVAIDMDSINRISRYDVRFRYLIGKDLVQASVNCDSSLVTPNQGKPFVPDMTGATREMIKLACGDEQIRAYDRGYGNGSRTISNANGIDARGFFVPSLAILATRNVLAEKGNPAAGFSDFEIADRIAMYCEIRSMGYSDVDYKAQYARAALNSSRYSTGLNIAYYGGAAMGAAKVSVCPQYDD